MKLLDLLAEALNAEKEAALKAKFVNPPASKDDPMGMNAGDPRKISEKEFKILVDSDPTSNGSYLQWMLNKYTALDRTERKRFIQDGHNERVKELLDFFNKPSNKPILKKAVNNPKIKEKVGNIYLDINQYKSLHDFENIMSSIRALTSGEEEPTSNDIETSGEPKFVETLKYPRKIGITASGYTVYEIPESCRGNKECLGEYRQLIGCRGDNDKFNDSRSSLINKGEDTEAPSQGYKISLCTRFPERFSFYLKNGSYYLFINWNKRRIFQLHYESGQFMDEADDPLGSYNKDLENSFLQFLLDKEGIVPPKRFNFNLDLSRFRKGESPNGFPVYEINNKLYMDFGNQGQNVLFYYDEKTNKLKNQDSDGRAVNPQDLVRMPYIDLIRYAYNSGKNVPPLYKIFLDLDIPKNLKFPFDHSLDFSNSDFKTLPANLSVNGDLNLTNSKLRELPDNLVVKGLLTLTGTDLKPKPDTRAGKTIR
jgi:hypothetical protein